MDRLTQLQKFFHEDPTDPFNTYALALEYQKLDNALAIELFEKLIINHSTYIPTYYQLGNLYEQIGKRNEALKVLEDGMTQARNQKDLKALRELKAAYNSIMFE
jgi:tetratricopeptide (TPR) repeat protein